MPLGSSGCIPETKTHPRGRDKGRRISPGTGQVTEQGFTQIPVLQLKKNPAQNPQHWGPPVPVPGTDPTPPHSPRSAARGSCVLVSRDHSRDPSPFGNPTSFQPHSVPLPRALADPCWKTPELPLGRPPGNQELGEGPGITGLFLELSLELLSLCPFRQQPWHVPSSRRVAQPAPSSLCPCRAAKPHTHSWKAQRPQPRCRALPSAPLPKIPSLPWFWHPPIPVPCAGCARGWGIAGSGRDGVSWEPALPD